MQVQLDTPGTTWQVRYDQALVEALDAVDDSIQDAVREAAERVAGNPLAGTARTARVDGDTRQIRVEMAAYAAVVWEVNPTTDARPDSEADVDRVYVHGVVERGVDGEFTPADAVRGPKRPARQQREFGVRFSEYDVQDRISDLHAHGDVQVEDSDWREDGVVVAGVVEAGRNDAVVETVGAGADVRFRADTVAAR